MVFEEHSCTGSNFNIKKKKIQKIFQYNKYEQVIRCYIIFNANNMEFLKFKCTCDAIQQKVHKVRKLVFPNAVKIGKEDRKKH